MTIEALIGLAAIVTSLLTGCLAWLLADAKSKARFELSEKRVGEIAAALATLSEDNKRHITALELSSAGAAKDIAANTSAIDRLDAAKASKEATDGLRQELGALRQEMDRRFDRLERILLDGKGRSVEE